MTPAQGASVTPLPRQGGAAPIEPDFATFAVDENGVVATFDVFGERFERVLPEEADERSQ